MSWFTLLMPWMLMVHNMVDFRENGAQDSYIEILNHIVTEWVEMLEDNNNLKLINKTGTFDDKVRHIVFQFQAYDRRDMAGARDMVLGLIDSAIAALNTGCSGRLCPFLCPCPFTPCDVEIEIDFIDQCKYNYPTPGTIKYVTYSGNTISYYTEGRRCMGTLELLRDESLDFARHFGRPPAVICR